MPPSQCQVLEAEVETTESWKLALSKLLAQDRKSSGVGTSCKSALFMSEVGVWVGSLKYKGRFCFFPGEQEHQD